MMEHEIKLTSGYYSRAMECAMVKINCSCGKILTVPVETSSELWEKHKKES